ncbi:hypothetical protein POSPLADRAFT_1044113 [Postia placenta MAD-698-R-SB12]|uniref:Uncharacterized protein n=1 Tax=Postia placenta MAD-698-R-SB12 TaxID=670580 RepID=A0A1X6N7H6_9APHY|nr:hypothetical protein POSPLADRAFT_1044113 [Postia placenta MAD-698-R-SB12]OSX64599.1 hypothetical protein POSPLADRAFT_1044113 [Postia placenta MAD-698-R-SB12]
MHALHMFSRKHLVHFLDPFQKETFYTAGTSTLREYPPCRPRSPPAQPIQSNGSHGRRQDNVHQRCQWFLSTCGDWSRVPDICRRIFETILAREKPKVLKAIAEFLARMRRQNQKLHGVIYLHRITDNRMGGTALRNFRMFRELCGIKALASCVIVLNMWNEVSEDVATARERELRETDIFFKPAMDAGASMLHHTNSPSSAQEILRDVVKKEPVVLQIQEEIVEQGKPIYETSAGVALLGDLAARQQRQLAQLQEMQRELEEAIDQQNESDRRELEEIEAGIKAKTAQLERDQEFIRKDPIPEPRIDCRPQPKWMGALLVVAGVLTFWKRGRAQNG